MLGNNSNTPERFAILNVDFSMERNKFSKIWIHMSLENHIIQFFQRKHFFDTMHRLSPISRQNFGGGKRILRRSRNHGVLPRLTKT